jgi:hypothetical protein
MARNLRRISGALQSAELLTRREFWGRIESGEARTLMVILLRSWRKIATGHGEEAIDIAENMFLNLCRFATSDADLHARLSVSVFAACWAGAAASRHSEEVLGRWLPMQVTTPTATLPIDSVWFAFPVSPKDDAREIFDTVATTLDTLVKALPQDEQHDPLSGGWDRQV